MAKILLIANFIHRPGGAGRLEAYLAKAVSLLNHECVLLIPAKPHQTNERIMKGCKNRPCRNPMLGNLSLSNLFASDCLKFFS